MNNLIQWPRAKYWDKAWNPIVGCKQCSPACANCYAAAMMRRFGAADFSPRITTRVNPPRKGVVFCGNMTDLFGEWVHYLNNYIGDTAVDACKGIYLYLTKRVERMCQALTGDNGITRYDPKRGYEVFKLYDSGEVDMSNHYFGFTAENQEWHDRRVIRMNNWPEWVNTWVSCEPLLGTIDLDAKSEPIYKWVVVGAESGPKRRPCKIEWVESIVDQCRAANIPVFVKQLDLNGKCERDITKFPKHLQIRQVPWARETNHA